MVGSPGWSPVRSSAGGKAELAALLGQVDNETIILMGHTRWCTRGNEFNNRNNHPIRAGIVIGTHNGTIYNADYLFRRLGLPRYAEVDSRRSARSASVARPETGI